MAHKPRRLVIKEELVGLTDDVQMALLLNQMLYWLPRRKDYEAYLDEERTRSAAASAAELQHGWIYKSGQELEDELMGISGGRTLRRKLTELVALGWLKRRRNPHSRWDHTWQYRVELRRIQRALAPYGFKLEGFPTFDDS